MKIVNDKKINESVKFVQNLEISSGNKNIFFPIKLLSASSEKKKMIENLFSNKATFNIRGPLHNVDEMKINKNFSIDLKGVYFESQGTLFYFYGDCYVAVSFEDNVFYMTVLEKNKQQSFIDFETYCSEKDFNFIFG